MAQVERVLDWHARAGIVRFETKKGLVGGCVCDAHGQAISDADIAPPLLLPVKEGQKALHGRGSRFTRLPCFPRKGRRGQRAAARRLPAPRCYAKKVCDWTVATLAPVTLTKE